MPGQGNGAVAPGAKSPLSDPVAEARRLIGAAAEQGLTVRALGGVAVCLLSPEAGPLLPRQCGDIDLATSRDGRRGIAGLLKSAGYAEDEMFNALHGSRRLLFYDEVNERKSDGFVGKSSWAPRPPSPTA